MIALGLPECGKSAGMKALVRAEPRLVVWDPNDEHQSQGCTRVGSLADLYAAMLAADSKPARLAISTPFFSDFPAVCRLVRAWAARAPCTFLVEELGAVVPPGKAPVHWGDLVRSGRHRGLKVRAVGHSPREIDKTSLKMATAWRVHSLGPADREYMAEEILELPVTELDGLAPFDYVEVDRSYPRTAKRLKTSPI